MQVLGCTRLSSQARRACKHLDVSGDSIGHPQARDKASRRQTKSAERPHSILETKKCCTKTTVIPNWTAPARVPSSSARPLLLEEDDYAVNNSKGTASPYPLKCWVPIGPTVVVCLLSRLERPTNAGMHIQRKPICHLTVRRLRHLGLWGCV